ncbi:MAG: helix-turn-helix transcriptional regulator [Eubacteriales bacterium]|nr:helix-turn-helix transcriptional regulator [Eubacteriales bacterium]
MTFGEKVKELRIRKGLSQKQLGEKMGIRQQTVAQYEKAIEQPKLATVRKISNALDVTIGELVTDWSEFSPGEIFEDMEDNEIDYSAINPRQAANDNRIVKYFHDLNYAGQEKAIAYTKDLTKIPDYQKEDE